MRRPKLPACLQLPDPIASVWDGVESDLKDRGNGSRHSETPLPRILHARLNPQEYRKLQINEDHSPFPV
jgi:hypothetical protein